MSRRGLVNLNNRSDAEFSCIRRVLRVLARIDGETLRKIVSAYDHKGTLNIAWAELPEVTDMCHVEKEWGMENEKFLSYSFPGGLDLDIEIGATIRTSVAKPNIS